MATEKTHGLEIYLRNLWKIQIYTCHKLDLIISYNHFLTKRLFTHLLVRKMFMSKY